MKPMYVTLRVKDMDAKIVRFGDTDGLGNADLLIEKMLKAMKPSRDEDGVEVATRLRKEADDLQKVRAALGLALPDYEKVSDAVAYMKAEKESLEEHLRALDEKIGLHGDAQREEVIGGLVLEAEALRKTIKSVRLVLGLKKEEGVVEGVNRVINEGMKEREAACEEDAARLRKMRVQLDDELRAELRSVKKERAAYDEQVAKIRAFTKVAPEETMFDVVQRLASKNVACEGRNTNLDAELQQARAVLGAALGEDIANAANRIVAAQARSQEAYHSTLDFHEKREKDIRRRLGVQSADSLEVIADQIKQRLDAVEGEKETLRQRALDAEGKAEVLRCLIVDTQKALSTSWNENIADAATRVVRERDDYKKDAIALDLDRAELRKDRDKLLIADIAGARPKAVPTNPNAAPGRLDAALKVPPAEWSQRTFTYEELKASFETLVDPMRPVLEKLVREQASAIETLRNLLADSEAQSVHHEASYAELKTSFDDMTEEMKGAMAQVAALMAGAPKVEEEPPIDGSKMLVACREKLKRVSMEYEALKFASYRAGEQIDNVRKVLAQTPETETLHDAATRLVNERDKARGEADKVRGEVDKVREELMKVREQLASYKECVEAMFQLQTILGGLGTEPAKALVGRVKELRLHGERLSEAHRNLTKQLEASERARSFLGEQADRYKRIHRELRILLDLSPNEMDEWLVVRVKNLLGDGNTYDTSVLSKLYKLFEMTACDPTNDLVGRVEKLLDRKTPKDSVVVEQCKQLVMEKDVRIECLMGQIRKLERELEETTNFRERHLVAIGEVKATIQEHEDAMRSWSESKGPSFVSAEKESK